MAKKLENHEKSQKISKIHFFFQQQKKNITKKLYPLSFPILGGCDLTRALQFSPFQISGGVP